jgi:predicted DNA-binding transcriptional regulator AlpA
MTHLRTNKLRDVAEHIAEHGKSFDLLINEKTTAVVLGISPDTLRRLGQRGEGPKRRKISPRRVGYKLSEVEAYRDGTNSLATEPASRHGAARSRSRAWQK